MSAFRDRIIELTGVIPSINGYFDKGNNYHLSVYVASNKFIASSSIQQEAIDVVLAKIEDFACNEMHIQKQALKTSNFEFMAMIAEHLYSKFGEKAFDNAAKLRHQQAALIEKRKKGDRKHWRYEKDFYLKEASAMEKKRNLMMSNKIRFISSVFEKASEKKDAIVTNETLEHRDKLSDFMEHTFHLMIENSVLKGSRIRPCVEVYDEEKKEWVIVHDLAKQL